MTRYTDSVIRWLDFFGVGYIEVDGWRSRGSSTFNPIGSVNHHTAGARKGIVPSLGTCINGRPDVPGPLCHILLGRDKIARLIASGRANHAGKGGARGMVGNTSCFGLEVEHVGIAANEPIDWDQVDVAARIHAAWALAAEYDAEMVVQHWEWTTRKIDFVRGSVDPNWFRDLVAHYIARGRAGTKPPTSTSKDFLMALTDDEQRELLTNSRTILGQMPRKDFVLRDRRDGRVWVFTDGGRYWIRNMDALSLMIFAGKISGLGPEGIPNAPPGQVGYNMIDGVPEIQTPQDVWDLQVQFDPDLGK